VNMVRLIQGKDRHYYELLCFMTYDPIMAKIFPRTYSRIIPEYKISLYSKVIR